MLGFIGGSGIYEALPLENTREEDVTTPFGDPAAPVTVGEFAGTGREVAFVPRHGRDHQYSPTELPYRANVYALKGLGVTHVIASNAVGSLREDLPPRTLVVPDQVYDRTKHRSLTFFEGEIVVHQPFAEPYCHELSSHLVEAARAVGADVVEGGTYVCIEGPQFSTVAESEFYRDQGFDVVGMTAVPEAKLAREAELCYATVAGVTDFDVWKEGSEVTQEEVVENAVANEADIKEVVERAIETMPDERECDCGSTLDGSVATDPESIDAEARERYGELLGDYL